MEAKRIVCFPFCKIIVETLVLKGLPLKTLVRLQRFGEKTLALKLSFITEPLYATNSIKYIQQLDSDLVKRLMTTRHRVFLIQMGEHRSNPKALELSRTHIHQVVFQRPRHTSLSICQSFFSPLLSLFYYSL